MNTEVAVELAGNRKGKYRQAFALVIRSNTVKIQAGYGNQENASVGGLFSGKDFYCKI